MPRKPKVPAEPLAPTPGPVVIQENAVYQLRWAQAALHLPASTLKREIRQRRLRVSRRAGRYWILGAWLLEWLKDGEVKKKDKGKPSSGQQPGESLE